MRHRITCGACGEPGTPHHVPPGVVVKVVEGKATSALPVLICGTCGARVLPGEPAAVATTWDAQEPHPDSLAETLNFTQDTDSMEDMYLELDGRDVWFFGLRRGHRVRVLCRPCGEDAWDLGLNPGERRRLTRGNLEPFSPAHAVPCDHCGHGIRRGETAIVETVWIQGDVAPYQARSPWGEGEDAHLHPDGRDTRLSVRRFEEGDTIPQPFQPEGKP